MNQQIKYKCAKTMSLNTFNIDERSVRTTLLKVTNTGTILPDYRGKHENHKNAKEREEIVVQHIQLFKCLTMG